MNRPKFLGSIKRDKKQRRDKPAIPLTLDHDDQIPYMPEEQIVIPTQPDEEQEEYIISVKEAQVIEHQPELQVVEEEFAEKTLEPAPEAEALPSYEPMDIEVLHELSQVQPVIVEPQQMLQPLAVEHVAPLSMGSEEVLDLFQDSLQPPAEPEERAQILPTSFKSSQPKQLARKRLELPKVSRVKREFEEKEEDEEVSYKKIEKISYEVESSKEMLSQNSILHFF